MTRSRLRGAWLAIGLAAALAVLTSIPYLYAFAAQPPGRQFMGFFFLGDDANTYLAKMREGLDGAWRWTNRYDSEPGTGAWFFVWWIALGHLAGLLHVPLLLMFHAVRAAGAFAVLGAGRLFLEEFVPGAPARRFGIVFMATGLGMGYVIQAAGHPTWFGQPTDTLDWRMPELSAFYSILALPHFAWAAAFQGVAVVLTLRAAGRKSLGLGAAAGVAWLAESSIHAQMPILLGGAFAVALALRPPGWRGALAVAIAFAIPAPYVAYSYWASAHVPEVLRWSAQWRNNLPPDLPSLLLALLPQLALAAFAIPAAVRRRSRSDLLLLAWLVLLVAILWLPNPAGNLRRRFFDGLYMPLVALAARGLYEVVLPRLAGRRRGLLPFAYVSFAAIGSAFLLFAPIGLATAPQYSLSTDQVAALDYLDGHPPGVVLSTGAFGLYVPAYSSDTVYTGQYSETYDYYRKDAEARRVLAGEADARAFASEHGIEYLVWTSDIDGRPSGLGPPVFERPGAAVYRVRT